MRQTTRLLIASSAIFLTACGSLPPHNNTLIFAVNRKVGIDISPTNAANAGLTIGYSSNELAWVPLWANHKDGTPMVECQHNSDGQNKEPKKASSKVDTQSEASNPKTDSTTNPSPSCVKDDPRFIGKNAAAGVSGTDKDSYSVFASFGGKVDAKSEPGQPTASLGIASFFATGIAAQQLAENAQGLTAVATDGEKKIKQSNTAAFKGAEKELLALLVKTADDANKKSTSNELCLKKLSSQYDEKAPTRFAWVAGRSPTEATKALLANSTWSEDELNKLNGVAYGLTNTAQDDIEKKENKDKDKYFVARNAIGCASDVEKKALEAAPTAPSPAPTASAPTT